MLSIGKTELLQEIQLVSESVIHVKFIRNDNLTVKISNGFVTD